MKRGKLIAIEGSDGAGKKTQTEALVKLARANNYPIFSVSFPDYNLPTGKVIRDYLNGQFGNPTQLPPKMSSAFYTLNREPSASTLQIILDQRTNVFSDRHYGSNLIHQGAKIDSLDERTAFVEWCKRYELAYGIPLPDLTIALYVPTDEREKAMRNSRATLDGHESNRRYQEAVQQNFMWLAQTQPGWTLIDCMKGTERKSVEEVTAEIWEVIQPVLVK